MKSFIIILNLLMLTQSCNSRDTNAKGIDRTTEELKPKDEPINELWRGTISKANVTSYQYGTHQLMGSIIEYNSKTKERKLFALISDTVSLDDWIGKEVIIKGNKVKGYPVENGPELIKVIKIYD